MRFPIVCAYLGMSLAILLPRYKEQSWGWLDYTALTLFVLLLAWLLSGSAGVVRADSHEDAPNLVAFRLGKALNRVRSRLRGRA